MCLQKRHYVIPSASAIKLILNFQSVDGLMETRVSFNALKQDLMTVIVEFSYGYFSRPVGALLGKFNGLDF